MEGYDCRGYQEERSDIGWYDLAQDRKVWRSVVHGERVEAGVRRRRKRAKVEREQKGEEKQERGVKHGELKCPKCGRGFKGKKGGGFQRHVDTCGGGSSHSSSSGGGSSGDGGGGGGDSNARSSDALSCPKCSKVYKRIYWLTLHVATCGSLRSHE